MTDMNWNQSTGTSRMLSDDELNAVAGGTTKVAPAPSKPTSGTLFEIDDYSFDVEQVL